MLAGEGSEPGSVITSQSRQENSNFSQLGMRAWGRELECEQRRGSKTKQIQKKKKKKMWNFEGESARVVRENGGVGTARVGTRAGVRRLFGAKTAILGVPGSAKLGFAKTSVFS